MARFEFFIISFKTINNPITYLLVETTNYRKFNLRIFKIFFNKSYPVPGVINIDRMDIITS